MSITDEQIDRFSRQILVPEIGGRGQQRLLRSRVALRGDSEPLLVARQYLQGSGIDVRDSDATGDIQLLLASRPYAINLAAFERPVIFVDSSDSAGWYTRGTTATDCVDCTIAHSVAIAARRKPGTGAILPIALALGAAIAIDAIKELLGRSPASATLVQLSSGGTRRSITPLPGLCTCRAPRPQPQRAAG